MKIKMVVPKRGYGELQSPLKVRTIGEPRRYEVADYRYCLEGAAMVDDDKEGLVPTDEKCPFRPDTERWLRKISNEEGHRASEGKGPKPVPDRE